MMPRTWGAFGAVAAGGVLSLAFAPVAFGACAVLAIALLTLVQYRAPVWFGLLSGYLAGLVFFLLLLGWMRIIGVDAWIGAAAYCAIWFGLLGAATSLVTRLPGWPVWIAALWVLMESLRSSAPILGFTWGRLAFAQPDTPWGQFAAVLGQPGVTFALALVGCAVTAVILALRERRRRSGLIWAATAGAVTVVAAVIPLSGTGFAAADAGGATQRMTVAIVQGGTPQTGMGAMDVRRAVLDNHVTQTLDLATEVAAGSRPAPRLVLWPENSSDIDPLRNSEAARAITASAAAIDAPILVGAVMVAEDPAAPEQRGLWNVGLLWDPKAGPTQMYIKRHLVPFGEYVPFRALIAPHVDRLDRVASDFLPGDRPGLFTVDGTEFGDVICFEVAYDDVIHPLLDSDARFITVQTNNATFAGTAQPEQQLAISRMRAIEGGRPVLVAATTGISAAIAPNGRVASALDEGRTGSLEVDVPLDAARTPATTLGDIPEIVLALLGLGAFTWAVVRVARDRRRSRPRVGG